MGGSLESQATSAIDVTVSASVILGNIYMRSGTYGGYASGGASERSAQGRVGIVDGLFSVSDQAKVA